MQAIIVSAYGGTEALHMTDNLPAPTSFANQIGIEVYAAGINPFDVALLSGMYRSVIPVTFPYIPGGDISGVVTSVGKDVTGLAIGDHIYGSANVLSGGSGAFTQNTLAVAGRIAKKPENASWIQAAALPLVATSALTALEELMELKPDQKILIHGGSGGIGHIAIQLAKHMGAYVATTAGTADMPFVKKLGADLCIDYKTQRFDQLISGYDAVFDTVGGAVTEASFTVLRRNGILVSMKGKPDGTLTDRYGVRSTGLNTDINTERLNRITHLYESGHITAHVDRTYPLSDMVTAWELQKSGRQKGKIVITIR